MSLSAEQLATFDRILAAAEADIAETNAFIASPRGRRQIQRSGFGHIPMPTAITISAADVRALRSIRDALTL